METNIRNKCKAYTSLEQSKKLAEILPLESADMDYIPIINIDGEYSVEVNEWDNEHIIDEGWIPCWNLAALLGVIPKHIKDYNVLRIDISENEFAIWYDEIGCGVNNELPDITKKTAIDACYEMILKLHELKML